MVDESQSNKDANRQPSDSTMTFSGEFLNKLLAGEIAHEGLSTEEIEAITALPSGSALLLLRRGPHAGARFLLDSVKSTVGRHPNADIFLDDVTVSRKHAEFVREGKIFEVIDLGSLNGTYLNGDRVDRAALKDGDEVQIGKFRMTFFGSVFDSAGVNLQ